MEYNRSNDHLLGSITIFLIFALIASTTLLIALSLWLAEILGSLISAMVVIGLCATLLTLIIYFTTLRPAVCRLRHEMAMIYEVTRVVNSGYHYIAKFIDALFS